MARVPSITLKDGKTIPQLGLGTWQLTGSACERTVREALALGYAHIDTAEMYGNEEEIGRAISGADREGLFITSKVMPGHLAPEQVRASCMASLEKLGTDYLDLYLIHWPVRGTDYAATFKALRGLQIEGRVRSVGVSNFTTGHLQELLPLAEKVGLVIVDNQVEFHAELYQGELLAYCNGHGIALTAYSPLARRGLLENPVIAGIAKERGKAPAQVALAWLIAKGIVIIPKASSREHLAANMVAFDVRLTEEDRQAIDAIGTHARRIRPPFAEFGG